MTSNVARQVAGYFGRSDDQTDTELLCRFVANRDGNAFAALVERHGPMVFAVCRRVTGDWHSAEDAFQAAFVVFARKAGSVAPGSIAGWLHGVARRVARDARRSTLRRFRWERPVDEFPEPAIDSRTDDVDVRGVLDDELRKLPGKYRDLLVALDLEGRQRRPVAEGLGIPEGTLSSRLTAARKMLANRLARRGIAPAVVASVAANGPPVIAREVPRALLASAARIGSAAPGTVPEGIATLATGAIRAMTLRTYFPWIAGLLLTASAAIGIAAARSEPTPIDPPASPKPLLALAASFAPDPARPGPKPVIPSPNKILFCRGGHLILIDPEGKTEEKVAKTDDAIVLDSEDFRLSPDGKRLAAVAYTERPSDGGDLSKKKIWVREVGKNDQGIDLGAGKTVFWSGDGKELLIADFHYTAPGKATNHIVNLATRARTRVNLPEDHVVTDWSRDGKYFLTTQSTSMVGGKFFAPRVWVMNRDGAEHKALTDGKRMSVLGKFSPDGERALFMEMDVPPGRGREIRTLSVVEVASGKAMPVEGIPPDADLFAFCWSPDGKKIAYTWRRIPPNGAKPADQGVDSFLVICDPDGKNARTLVAEVASPARDAIAGIDWR